MNFSNRPPAVVATVVAFASFFGCAFGQTARIDADAPAAAAPAYGTDSGGNLWSIDLQTYALHDIGKEGPGVVLDAIAFDPANRKLYGIAATPDHTATTLYIVDVATARAAKQCTAPIGDATGGFSFDSAGSAYVYGNATRKLYTLGLTTCSISAGLTTMPYIDSDLLSISEGKLLMFALTCAGPPGDLVTVDPSSGTILKTDKLDVQYLFALLDTGAPSPYGITTDPKKGTSTLVRIQPAAPLAQRVVLVHDFGNATHGGFLSAAYQAEP
jgi:hypothetical protein